MDSLSKLTQIRAEQLKKQNEVDSDPLADLKKQVMSNSAQPEHYSWELGTPDNIPKTEVIVNPYSNQPVPANHIAQASKQQALAPMGERPVKNVAPKIKSNIPDLTPEHYKSSMSVNVDGKELLIPTIDPNGRELSPDEAYSQFEQTGQHLGAFDTPQDADDHTNSIIQSINKGSV